MLTLLLYTYVLPTVHLELRPIWFNLIYRLCDRFLTITTNTLILPHYTVAQGVSLSHSRTPIMICFRIDLLRRFLVLPSCTGDKFSLSLFLLLLAKVSTFLNLLHSFFWRFNKLELSKTQLPRSHDKLHRSYSFATYWPLLEMRLKHRLQLSWKRAAQDLWHASRPYD